MRWLRRIILALPFAIAAVLNVLGVAVDRLHLNREHTAEYVFLFMGPWGWLLDNGWLGNPQSRWLGAIVDYTLMLWIPALLYSVCFWALIRSLQFLAAYRSR